MVESEASGRGPLKKQSTRPRMILLRSLLRHAAQLEKVDASLVYRCSSQLREIRLIELIFERNSHSRAQSLPHDPFTYELGLRFQPLQNYSLCSGFWPKMKSETVGVCNTKFLARASRLLDIILRYCTTSNRVRKFDEFVRTLSN